MSGSHFKSVSATAGHVSGLVPIPSIEEKNKQIQQETMMEKLRAKYRVKPKTYEEMKKSVRMYFLEKHYPLDPVCKATLQSALDKLQHYIKVTSRHGLVERLESLSRQLGLKFMEDQQTLFISTDMFYVEILLDSSGNLNDVKVHHECKIEQQTSTSSSSSSSSQELLNCLKAGDFADFTVQLEGLSSIYQLNAEPKVKKKAFVALQAMETDIYNLYQHQLQLHQRNNGSSDSYQIMNNSSVGLVLPRRGGHPMKLTYFCPPLHLVEKKVKGEKGVVGSSGAESRYFNIDQVIKSPNGLSATLNLEGSSANKLQILPIVSFTSEDVQLEMPTYMPLSQNNSMLMPATYVLRLNKPMPVCIESLRALSLPGLPASLASEPGTRTVMNLIVETASRHAIRNTQKGLYVNLLRETHCYFLTDNRRLQGTMISSLPFTEPAQVPKIIAFLKKQALFCTLLSSCVREQQKHYNDMESTVILEVTAVSLSQITVELQHPYEESLATVDFLLDGDGEGQPSCTMYCLNYDYEELSLKLTRTLRQVYSIPMVIYKLLKCWDEEHQQKVHGVLPSPSSGSSGGNASGFGSSREGSAAGGMHGSSNFGQFAMDPGVGDGTSGGGGGGGFTSVSNMKMDNKVRSLADGFAASTSAAAAIAGLMNLKRETDPQASSDSSPNPLPTISSPASSSKDQEIADKYKNIWKDKTPNLKHCVSITPIAGDGKSSLQQQPQQVDVQRTGGIEIIPLNAPTSAGGGGGVPPGAGSPATTITITPITGSGKEAAKESKKSSMSGSGNKRPHESSSSSSSSSSSNSSSSSSSSGSSSNETQKEKKRKKKRDDSPMGPPEKIYSRQNSPGMTDGSSGSGVGRKFSTPAASSSPKAGGSAAGVSLGLIAGQSSARPSPKHSPVYSSPKHNSNSNTASNSPKSPFGTHSPKHGSSGKPSMSTLKSATAATSLSLSPKAEKSSAGSTASGQLSLPLGALPLGLTSTGSSSVPGPSAGSNPPMLRPVPPLASSSQLPLSIKKEKSSSSSSSSSTATHSSGVVAAAVAALKSSQQQQQQMKSTVASLSHLPAGASLGSYATPAVSAVELNALRKGLAGTGSGVGPGMGVGAAAGAVGAVSLMTSTPASTTTATATATQSAATTTTTTTAAALVASSTTAETTASVAETGTTVGTATQQQQAAALHNIYSSISSSSGIGGASSAAGPSGPGPGPGLSTEYMVKPSSQEGLKLTINKTGNNSSKKESKGGTSGSSASSGSSSNKKQHTGLKPGVNSGPASKKAPGGPPGGSSSSSKHLFQKANSSGNLSSKLSGSSGSGLPLTKSNSTNSFQEQQTVPKRRPSMCSLSNSGGQRKTPSASLGSGSGSAGGVGGMSPAALSGSMSQPPPRFDHHTDMMTILQYASPTMAASMEGFIKGLHNKFQIPKLSQRPSGNSGQGGRTTPNTEQQTATATATVTSSVSQEEQFNADTGGLAASLSATPSGSSGSQRPITGAAPSANDLLLTLNTGDAAAAGDGFDEELLASLAGE